MEEEIAKGTVGRTVRGAERDRYKDGERHNRNKRESQIKRFDKLADGAGRRSGQGF